MDFFFPLLVPLAIHKQETSEMTTALYCLDTSPQFLSTGRDTLDAVAWTAAAQVDGRLVQATLPSRDGSNQSLVAVFDGAGLVFLKDGHRWDKRTIQQDQPHDLRASNQTGTDTHLAAELSLLRVRYATALHGIENAT